MKQSVIREMTTEEIQDRLSEEYGTYDKLRINHSVSQLENPLRLRSKRKIIARLRTELRNREIAEQSN